jgi:hypothetical protein
MAKDEFGDLRAYGICDEALECTEKMLVPYRGTGLGMWKDSFNYHLSSMRQFIQRAFGMLMERWGIFWRPLRVGMDRWASIIMCCAALHNLCIDQNIEPETYHEDHEAGDGIGGFFDSMFNADDVNGDTRPSTAHNQSIKRVLITQYLESHGYRRPSKKNSRA